MVTITVEALLRSDDWLAKRDSALGSVFVFDGSKTELNEFISSEQN